MENSEPGQPANTGCRKRRVLSLDNVNLERQCPLDNFGRCIDASIRPRFSVGQLDQLPSELLILVLLYTDIPSLTRFRRVNRRAMDLVSSVPEYAAIIKHCPDIIHDIVSMEADAYDCRSLFATLSTTRCSTCEGFGELLYLIDCSRVCSSCFEERPEWTPFAVGSGSVSGL